MGNKANYDLEKENAILRAANGRLEKRVAELTPEPPIDLTPYGVRGVQRDYFIQKLTNKGVEVIEFDDSLALAGVIFGTTMDGWVEGLADITIKATFWLENVRMCGWYAFHSQVECAERYNINGLRMCVQRTNREIPHAYCLFPIIEQGQGITDFAIFEPNMGFPWFGILPWGEENYTPDYVLV